MSIFDIVAVAVIAVSSVTAVLQLGRMTGPRARTVVSRPAGSVFRLNLLPITGGILILLNGQEGSDTSRVLSFALTWLAILIWDRGIWLKARTGQAPRPGVGSN